MTHDNILQTRMCYVGGAAAQHTRRNPTALEKLEPDFCVLGEYRLRCGALLCVEGTDVTTVISTVLRLYITRTGARSANACVFISVGRLDTS